MNDSSSSIALIIPAYDEEGSIEAVVRDFAAATWPDGSKILSEIVVTDNNSKDRTAAVARAAGATVVFEAEPGYGRACLRAMSYLVARPQGPPSVVVYADGDGSNDPLDLARLLAPISKGYADLVIGSRAVGADPGSLTLPQRFGNRLACQLMLRTHGAAYSDLGPFRAIRWTALQRLGMSDPTYGWTIEMQLKAVKQQLRVREVPVHNHARTAGRSKVSGTIEGVVGAGVKILSSIWRYR